jgi:glycosyltransferase involved in cell wall biosynthesis
MRTALDIYEPNTLTTNRLNNVSLSKPVDIALATSRPPLVSCLMVTRGDTRLIASALYCFNQQTYENRELVIVCDDPSSKIENLIEATNPGSRNIILVYVEKRYSLGEQRNIAITQARGEIVCPWDDDDLSYRGRLKIQASILLGNELSAVFLKRTLLWWPARRILATGERRIWEGSMLARKSCVPRYPAQRRSEDTLMVDQMCSIHRIGLLDLPSVYCYVIHGDNTSGESHFDAIMNRCSHRFDYQETITMCSNFIPFEKHKSFPGSEMTKQGDASGRTTTDENYFEYVNYTGVTRNASCPCCSGKRFKHCHGALR